MQFSNISTRLTFCFVLFTSILCGQTSDNTYAYNDNAAIIDLVANETTSPSTAFVPAKQLNACFDGGQEALANYLQNNLDYPELAREYGVEGMVVIRFKVMPDGSLQHFSVQESLNKECDTKVLDVVKAMPNWIPAQQGERKVANWCDVTVAFTLQ